MSDADIFLYGNNFSEEDDMSQVTQVCRSQGVKYDDGYVTASYSRLFYSWGYNFTALDIKDATNDKIKQKWICSGLAYVPVDYLPLYIPKSLFDDLPSESTVEEVTCKITPWGSRITFQANADTTKPATAPDAAPSEVGCP